MHGGAGSRIQTGLPWKFPANRDFYREFRNLELKLETVSEKIAAPQRYFAKFPMPLSRENISRTRELRGTDQRIYVGIQ